MEDVSAAPDERVETANDQAGAQGAATDSAPASAPTAEEPPPPVTPEPVPELEPAREATAAPLDSQAALLPMAPGVVVDEAPLDQEPTLRNAKPRAATGGPEREPPLRLAPLGKRRGTIPRWAPYATIAALIGLPLILLAVLLPALLNQARRAAQPDRLPGLTTRLQGAKTLTPLDPANAAFGAQAYPVAPDFAAYYAAHNGPASLGAALTPAFPSNLGETQFFTNGALVGTGQRPITTLAGEAADGPGDLPPDLLRDGADDSAQGVVALPLSQELLALGSAAPIGAANSGVSYATLRAAAQPGAFLATPKVTADDEVVRAAGAPEVILTASQAYVVEGTRAGASACHSLSLGLWEYINRADVAPDGWAADVGAPLTEPLAMTATVNGAPHHLLVQAFAQVTLIVDTDTLDANGAPLISAQPAGRDFLQTVGGPTIHAGAQAQRWLTADGALRVTAGGAAVAIGLNANSAVTLSGGGQWVDGALWYTVGWQSPARAGVAWAPASALTEAAPGVGPVDGFDVLSPDLARYLSGRGSSIGVVAYDVTRGVTYTYNSRGLFIMASSAKVPLLVSYLEYIESQHRGPNSYEVGVMSAMIEQSDNNAAQVIYDTVGYDSGQRAHMRGWGITDYQSNPNGWGWGMWSPRDMAHLLALLQSGKVLNSADRNLAFYLMSHIESDQRFGVGDSAPKGAQFWMKNGWVVGPDGWWDVNSSGIVKVGSETYVVTVYNDGLGSFGQGIDIVNHVCGVIGQALK
ncbi:MAG TPA: serine hydrolase [Ktedonobacterales bacterium]